MEIEKKCSPSSFGNGKIFGARRRGDPYHLDLVLLPLFLRQRSYHFRRNWGYISFQFPFKSFYLFPRPFFETSKHEDKLLLLGTHTRKRITVALPLTTSFSFMNFIVIEIHVLPRQNLELAILLPNRQRLTSVERLIHSDRYEDPTPLHCQNPCSIFEAG